MQNLNHYNDNEVELNESVGNIHKRKLKQNELNLSHITDTSNNNHDHKQKFDFEFVNDLSQDNSSNNLLIIDKQQIIKTKIPKLNLNKSKLNSPNIDPSEDNFQHSLSISNKLERSGSAQN